MGDSPGRGRFFVTRHNTTLEATAMIDSLCAAEAWTFLEAQPQARLVDVRTRAEWMFVGIANLDTLGRKPVLIEWSQLGGTLNPTFLDQLTAELPLATPLLMMCRSGARSLAAGNAALGAGYQTVINISDGFEGDLDPFGHRGQINGWRHAGLPWQQS